MENKAEASVNIGLGCSENLMAAMENDSELNNCVNNIIERFLSADWGKVPAETAADNDKVIASLSGKAMAEYSTTSGDFSITMTFSDKENAMIMVDYL